MILFVSGKWTVFCVSARKFLLQKYETKIEYFVSLLSGSNWCNRKEFTISSGDCKLNLNDAKAIHGKGPRKQNWPRWEGWYAVIHQLSIHPLADSFLYLNYNAVLKNMTKDNFSEIHIKTPELTHEYTVKESPDFQFTHWEYQVWQ